MPAGSGARLALVAFVLALTLCNTALAQKSGGILKIYHRDSPASMSVLEEASLSTSMPMMPVFNNLVLYDQHVAQNSRDLIVPDLAESWSTSGDGTRLTFKLRRGVKWHDGKPFTAADVKCTWDLLQGTAAAKLRLNPRRAWYSNVDGSHRRGRRYGGVRAETAAAGADRAAGLGLCAGLPVPRPAAGNAHPSDRHRPVQIRRVQAQRVRSSW